MIIEPFPHKSSLNKKKPSRILLRFKKYWTASIRAIIICGFILCFANAQSINKRTPLKLDNQPVIQKIETETFTISDRLYFRPFTFLYTSGNGFGTGQSFALRTRDNLFIPSLYVLANPRNSSIIFKGEIENIYRNAFFRIGYNAYFPYRKRFSSIYDFEHFANATLGYYGIGYTLSLSGNYGQREVTAKVVNSTNNEELQTTTLANLSGAIDFLLIKDSINDVQLSIGADVTYVPDSRDITYSFSLNAAANYGKTLWGQFFSSLLLATVFENSTQYVFRKGFFERVSSPDIGPVVGNISSFDLGGHYVVRGTFGYMVFPFANFNQHNYKALKGIFLAASTQFGWVHDQKRRGYAHQLGYSFIGTIGYRLGSRRPFGFSVGWNNAYGLLLSFKLPY